MFNDPEFAATEALFFARAEQESGPVLTAGTPARPANKATNSKRRTPP